MPKAHGGIDLDEFEGCCQGGGHAGGVDGCAGGHGRTQPRFAVVSARVVAQVEELRRNPLRSSRSHARHLDPGQGRRVAVGVERAAEGWFREPEGAQVEDLVTCLGSQVLPGGPAPLEGTVEDPGSGAVPLGRLGVDLDLGLELV